MTPRILTVLVLALLLSPVGTSTADPERIGLSSDGTTFGTELPQPLFSPSVDWVPGDSRDAMLYVRNQGGSAAVLTVDILGRRPSELLDSGDLSITASVPGGTSYTPVEDADEHRLIGPDVIADGAVVPVTLRVAFDPASPGTTRLISSDLDFRVTLRQAGDAERSGSGTPGDGPVTAGGSGHGDLSGLLPDTGAQRLTLYAAVAMLLLATGGFLIARRRNDNQGASHG